MRTRIALVCTVWGAEFTDFFCQYSLATLLSPTNLPRACTAHDFTLLLYTGEDDLARMQAHANFRKLAALVDIKPVFFADLPPTARSGHWIQWHHALLSSDEFSSFILLIPDCLYANDTFQQIADALEDNDVVFYCIPQICLEPSLPFLNDATRCVQGESPHSYLDFSALDIASLFIKFINPRYAVALHRPDYFVTHPEYILRASKGRVEIHEITCHALAVSSRAKDVSYALNPMSEFPKAAFLGLLAVGVEYTFKYFEQYFRWPSSQMQLSRHGTLASWSYTFFERGVSEYNKTKTEIAVSGLEASALRRTAVSNPRVKYARAAFQYYASLYAIHAGPAGGCRPEVKRAIALAMSVPGFRKHAMKLTGPATILLPAADEAASVLDVLYRANDPELLLQIYIAAHIAGATDAQTGASFHPPAHRRRAELSPTFSYRRYRADRQPRRQCDGAGHLSSKPCE